MSDGTNNVYEWNQMVVMSNKYKTSDYYLSLFKMETLSINNGIANQETCLRQCMRKLKAYRGGGTSPLPQRKNHLCKMGIGLVKVCDGNKE